MQYKLQINLFLTLAISFLSIQSLSAIEPPKKGVKLPNNFEQLKQNIEQSYGQGYYAQKMDLRRLLRDRIASGEISVKSLVADTVHALCLLGKYSDSSPKFAPQDLQTKLFDGPNPTGTMTQFYKEISYNQMYFTGSCKGWYQVPGNMASYVGSDNGLGSNEGPKFVYDLVVAADNDVNYADYIQYYDASGNPRIGMVAAIHTGAGSEAGANNIWSHKWSFGAYTGNQPYVTNDIDPVSGKNVIIDGTYACEPELSGSSNTSGNLIDIGVFCHEFGHVFGLPDLYDTDGSSEGIGQWCLMASGSWGGNGSSPQTPTHMSAWCKQRLGWVTPIAIDSLNMNFTFHNAEQNPAIYKMWKQNQASSEYFLVENRQKLSFDQNLMNSGLLIYHIDDTRTNNKNENHYWVDVEQADGLRGLNLGANRGDAGDPFPGSTNNTKFDFLTTPSSNGYSATSFVSVRNIHNVGLDMIADLDVGTKPYASCPPTFFVGNVEVPQAGVTNGVTLKNYGLAPLVITSVLNQAGPFKLTDNLTLPLSIATYDSVTLHFKFEPSQVGLFQQNITIANNDPTFTGLVLQGRGFKVDAAQNNMLYAASGSSDSGKILTINPTSGVGTNLGSSLYSAMNSISVNPKSGIIYGMTVTSLGTEFVRVNAVGGDSYNLFTVPQKDMTAVAFDTLGNLYAAARGGLIYSVNLESKTISKICSTKVQLTSVAFDPTTNQLYGTPYIVLGSTKDRIFKINLSTGDTTLLGKTGFGVFTVGIAFDNAGQLFGVTSTSGNSNFNSIDKNTGKGTLIGSVGLSGITGIAFSASEFTSVNPETEKPTSFKLMQNYPNPFNPSTSIEYSVPVDSYVKIVIYNILGEVIDVPVDNNSHAGQYKISWNGANKASGIYFYELTAKTSSGEAFKQIKKLVLLK